jgi:hypothetical protein
MTEWSKLRKVLFNDKTVRFEWPSFGQVLFNNKTARFERPNFGQVLLNDKTGRFIKLQMLRVKYFCMLLKVEIVFKFLFANGKQKHHYH